MSKWKEAKVKIIQAWRGQYNIQIYGLGDDSMVYEWNGKVGAWAKFWDETDPPPNQEKEVK